MPHAGGLPVAGSTGKGTIDRKEANTRQARVLAFTGDDLAKKGDADRFPEMRQGFRGKDFVKGGEACGVPFADTTEHGTGRVKFRRVYRPIHFRFRSQGIAGVLPSRVPLCRSRSVL